MRHGKQMFWPTDRWDTKAGTGNTRPAASRAGACDAPASWPVNARSAGQEGEAGDRFGGEDMVRAARRMPGLAARLRGDGVGVFGVTVGHLSQRAIDSGDGVVIEGHTGGFDSVV